MTRFRIDSPDIDIEALQERVEAAVERKRGKRFSAGELEALRCTPLRPRVRRDDLPRGMVGEMRDARARLPEVPPSPSPDKLDRGAPPSLERQPRPRPDLSAALSTSARGGLAGRLLGLVRRLLRPLFRLGPNLDHAFGQVGEHLEHLADRDDRYLDHTMQRLDLAVDALKQDADRRVDRIADWAGEHVSSLTGALERRQERQLHLLHNLVQELTSVRLDLDQTQDRLNELTRRMEALQERERALESLTLEDDEGPQPAARE